MTELCGFLLIDGDVLTVEEPSRLRIGFNAHWDEDVESEPAGILDYALEDGDESGEVTKLTVTLGGLQGATAAAAEADTPRIYSSLKSALETGAAFQTSRFIRRRASVLRVGRPWAEAAAGLSR